MRGQRAGKRKAGGQRRQDGRMREDTSLMLASGWNDLQASRFIKSQR
jgi:hypothetical protein